MRLLKLSKWSILICASFLWNSIWSSLVKGTRLRITLCYSSRILYLSYWLNRSDSLSTKSLSYTSTMMAPRWEISDLILYLDLVRAWLLNCQDYSFGNSMTSVWSLDDKKVPITLFWSSNKGNKWFSVAASSWIGMTHLIPNKSILVASDPLDSVLNSCIYVNIISFLAD